MAMDEEIYKIGIDIMSKYQNEIVLLKEQWENVLSQYEELKEDSLCTTNADKQLAIQEQKEYNFKKNLIIRIKNYKINKKIVNDLKEAGLTESQIITELSLGYMLNQKDLTTELIEEGFTLDIIKAKGIDKLIQHFENE